MSQRRPWLSHLCSHNNRYSWSAFVQSVTGPDGRPWSMATNLDGLIALSDGGVMAKADRAVSQNYKSLNDLTMARQASRLLTVLVPNAPDYLCELADLRQWIGRPVSKPCLECKGEGTTGTPGEFDYCICNQCDGDGVVEPIRSVRLLPDCYLDTNLVSRYLPRRLLNWSRCCEVGLVMGAGAVMVRSVEPCSVPWIVVLMSLNNGAHWPQGSNPRSPPRYVPGLGAVWHWRTDRRYMLSDWLAERGEDVEEIDPQHV